MNDPLKQLLGFHGVLRRALRTLQSLGDRPPGAVTAADVAPLIALLNGPVVFHDIDEESLLIPLILERLGPGVDVDPGLQRCQRDHEHLEAQIEALLPHLQAISAGDPSDPEVLLSAATRLTALLLPHLDLEEQLIFPIARRLLTPADLKFMRAALDARESARHGAPPEVEGGAKFAELIIDET